MARLVYTEKEIREAGLDDFRVFLVQVWDHLGLPMPTPVQLDMARWLQHGGRRLILEAFRGVGKSWMTATFALWLLFLNPNLNIEIVSASQGLGDNISKFMQGLINDMPLLQHLRSRPGQRASGIEFDVGPAGVSKDPSVKSAGINGQITGTRADLIIADDIEVPANSFTHHLREKLRNRVTEFDAIIKPGGRVIYLGTPQVEESLYPHLGDKIDPNTNAPLYQTRIWTAEIPENPDKYGSRLAPYIRNLIAKGAEPGDPVDPDRFDRRDLAERKASYGASGYALQFMLDTEPASGDRHPLKLGDLIVTDVDDAMGHLKLVWGRDKVLEDLPAGGFDGDRFHAPVWKSEEMSKWGGTVMAIDPSGRGKDELAYAIVRHHHSTLYLVKVGGFVDGYSEATLSKLAAVAGLYRVNKIITERNYGGGMFDQLLKPYLTRVNRNDCLECAEKGRQCDHSAGVLDEEWKGGWSVGMKESRILDILEPITQQHRLVVDRRVIEDDVKLQRDSAKRHYSWVQQYTRMERLKGALPHEDRLEATAMACEYWTDFMSQDRDKAVERHRADTIKAELKGFINNAFQVGRKRGRKKWH